MPDREVEGGVALLVDARVDGDEAETARVGESGSGAAAQVGQRDLGAVPPGVTDPAMDGDPEPADVVRGREGEPEDLPRPQLLARAPGKEDRASQPEEVVHGDVAAG